MKTLAAILVFTFLGTTLAEEDCKGGKVLICYYGSWGVYRPGIGHIEVEDIDPTLCTHLVYSFAGLDLIQNSIVSLDPAVDLPGGQNSYKRFLDLKKNNTCLKTLLAIGGWNENPKKYSIMAYDDASRKSFADRALRFITQYGFDGLDFDWEYPTERGGIAEDKENFVLLLKELHNRFQKWGYMLTVAVAAMENVIAKGYNIKEIVQYVDYVSVMAYDYTSSESKVTGLLAPLSSDIGIPAMVNKGIPSTVDSVKKLIAGGCPLEKLVVGIPLYGRIFKLADPSKTGIGAPTLPIDIMGNYTKEPGFLSTYELKDLMEEDDSYKVKYDYGSAYATNGKYWITYDDEQTIEWKVKEIKKMGLAGVMAWSIDTDDFKGYFNDDEVKFPLLRKISEELKKK